MGRLPERDTRVGATDSRFKWRPSNAAIAVIFILVFTVGPYLAFTKHVPFTGYGYTLNATFSNGVNISTNSPVRIAGVEQDQRDQRSDFGEGRQALGEGARVAGGHGRTGIAFLITATKGPPMPEMRTSIADQP